MSTSNKLYPSLLEKAFQRGLIKKKIPKYITNNLRFRLYEWQNEAIERLLLYQDIKEIESPTTPSHLMFNMATGSGKTLLMAAFLLFYFKQGYKHFLFFVNQNNIVDKTENNFVNRNHTKYLFNENIIIDNQIIDIQKVDNFNPHANCIQIKFTTIQKLYNDIHVERENQTIFDELSKMNIIMFADEAHHLNSQTSNTHIIQDELIESELTGKSSIAEIERKGWEHTVIDLILEKNGASESRNILLEFTATIPANEEVEKKYEDKILYQFGLKEFLSAGYTKEINLISSTLDKEERILQALLFNWYRHSIALKYGIPNFKPVILFRSKSIVDSKDDYGFFNQLVSTISVANFGFLDKISEKLSMSDDVYEQGKSRTEMVQKYIDTNEIMIEEIIMYIKRNFQERNIIITNSETNTAKNKEKTTEEQEYLLNSLEDKNNPIRAIFTVERLTEGWDVLNLYDIVRLYQSSNTGGASTSVPDATIKEKQLIGRGVRYFPFDYLDYPENKRKFDNDIQNELRILEELFYYTYDEKSRYISHLKDELRKDGYIQDHKSVETFSLKDSFKNSDFYTDTKVFVNKQIPNPNRRKRNLVDIKKSFYFNYSISGLEILEEEFSFDPDEKHSRMQIRTEIEKTEIILFKDFDRHIILKAINRLAKNCRSIYRYENLVIR